jgi:hypothetical protein
MGFSELQIVSQKIYDASLDSACLGLSIIPLLYPRQTIAPRKINLKKLIISHAVAVLITSGLLSLKTFARVCDTSFDSAWYGLSTSLLQFPRQTI